MGVTQSVTTWNKVKIEYETNKDGTKVIKKRTAVAQNLIRATSNQLGSQTGSMWATPVLEREAVKTAINTAKAMEGYLEYNNGGVWKPFTSLAITLNKPSSAPGWGYAVVRDGGTVSVADAENALIDFEKGDLTLDELFKELNVKLVTRDGGAEMIHHAVVVFRRTNPGDKWTLVTHYPNHKLTNADVGWECERDWRPGSVTFRAGLVTTTVSNRKLA